MQLQVKGKNLDLAADLVSYAEKKIGKLQKLLAEPTPVVVELAVERNPSITRDPDRGGDHLDERARASGPRGVDGHESLDRSARRQARAQVERYRDKRTVERRREASRSKETS